jgi:hypothetical protein
VIAQEGAPRVRWVPGVDACYDLADAAIELAADCGLVLDPWQEDELRAMLAFLPDGRWAASEVGACVPRQNGKNGITEVRQLAGLFLIHEFPVKRSSDPLAVHTAHLNDTAEEAFRRLENLIEANDELSYQVKRYKRANGKEAIEIKGGERIRYRARTKGGGRGYAGDDLYLDEAMFLPEFGYGALRPILAARPNPQIIYTGSAVDQEVHDDGVVFARVRERGLDGSDPRLVYFEHSLPYETPDEVPEEELDDPEVWARPNPALGVRIMAETVASERKSMSSRMFAVERLGVGDWPDTDKTNHVIDMVVWKALHDTASEALDPVCFTFAVAEDRSSASIAVGGKRSDGSVHVELIDRRSGTGWVAARLEELTGRHECLKTRFQGNGPAASLKPELDRLEVQVEPVNGGEMAQACGKFFDLVEQRALHHRGRADMEAALTSALKGAAKRTSGDAWKWDRTNGVEAVVAVTLAAWTASSQTARVPLIGSVSR